MADAQNLRSLKLYADDALIVDGQHMDVHGKATLSLQPDMWTINLYELSGAQQTAIRLASAIRVTGNGDSILVSGKPADVIRRTEGTRNITTILILDGEAFHRARVALSVASGAGVHDTVRMLMRRAGTGTPLAEIPSVPYRFPRGQVFHGRLSQAVGTLCRSAGWAAWIRNGQLNILRPGTGIVAGEITESDIVADPYQMEDALILQTDVVGRGIGRLYSLNLARARGDWRLAAMAVDADNMSGVWNCELTMVKDSVLVG